MRSIHFLALVLALLLEPAYVTMLLKFNSYSNANPKSFYSNRAINLASRIPKLFVSWSITVISLVVPCMYIFTIYVLLKSFDLTVLPRLKHEHLDTIKDDVIEFTKNLKKVSVKYMWFHRLWLIPSFTLGLFFALITKSYIGIRQELVLQMSNPDIKSDTVAESKLNNLLKILTVLIVIYAWNCLIFFGTYFISLFVTGYFNDYINRKLMHRLSDMLLNINTFYDENGLMGNDTSSSSSASASSDSIYHRKNTNHDQDQDQDTDSSTSIIISTSTSTKSDQYRKKLPKMGFIKAEKLLRDLLFIIPARNTGIDFGGLENISIQKSITLLTIFIYSFSAFLNSDTI